MIYNIWWAGKSMWLWDAQQGSSPNSSNNSVGPAELQFAHLSRERIGSLGTLNKLPTAPKCRDSWHGLREPYYNYSSQAWGKRIKGWICTDLLKLTYCFP